MEPPARHLDDDGRGSERELVRRAVAQLEVARRCARVRRRQGNVRHQIARLEHRLTVRGVARKQMKGLDRDRARALSLRTLHMNRRIECNERHVHVGRIGRDAVWARPEDGECAVLPVDRRASRARLALVARHGGVAEVHASRALEQVPTRCRNVAELGRRAREKRFRQHAIVAYDRRIVRQCRVAYERADSQPSLLHALDRVQSQLVDVDEVRRSLDAEFHQVDERRAAGHVAYGRALLRRRRVRRNPDRLRDRARSRVLEAFHVGPRCLPWSAFGHAAVSPHLLDRRDDVGIGAAAADIAAHQLLHIGVRWSARLLEQRDR